MVSFVDLVGQYYSKGTRTLAAFADGLNLCIIDPDEHYSRGAIFNWIHGENIPKYSMLEHIYNHAPVDSWQRDFAQKGMELLVCCDGNTDKAQPRADNVQVSI